MDNIYIRPAPNRTREGPASAVVLTVVALKQMDQLQIMTTEGPGGLLIMHLDGPLTLATLFDFQESVRQQQATGLILALDGVPYMDSAGLGAILGAYVSCQRQGRRFALAGMTRRVLTLFEVARVDALVPRFDTVEAAETALADQAGSA